MKHNRKNKNESRHDPWHDTRGYTNHDFTNGHRGAAHARMSYKRWIRQKERRSIKLATIHEVSNLEML